MEANILWGFCSQPGIAHRGAGAHTHPTDEEIKAEMNGEPTTPTESTTEIPKIESLDEVPGFKVMNDSITESMAKADQLEPDPDFITVQMGDKFLRLERITEEPVEHPSLKYKTPIEEVELESTEAELKAIEEELKSIKKANCPC